MPYEKSSYCSGNVSKTEAAVPSGLSNARYSPDARKAKSVCSEPPATARFLFEANTTKKALALILVFGKSHFWAWVGSSVSAQPDKFTLEPELLYSSIQSEN